MPKVSVITATYNGERFLEQTMASALSQENVDLEYVVVDDASSDGTRKIVSAFTDESSPFYDARVRAYFRDNRLGIEETYREGVERSTGDFIKILDHDDVLPFPWSLGRQETVLNSDENIWIVASSSHYIDQFSRRYKTHEYKATTGKVNKAQLRRRLLFSPTTPFTHGGMMSRREAYDAFRCFDQELLCNVLNSEKDIYYIDEPLFAYRTYPGNTSNTLATRIQMARYKAGQVEKLANNGLKPYVVPIAMYRVLVELGKTAWLQVRSKR